MSYNPTNTTNYASIMNTNDQNNFNMHIISDKQNSINAQNTMSRAFGREITNVECKPINIEQPKAEFARLNSFNNSTKTNITNNTVNSTTGTAIATTTTTSIAKEKSNNEAVIKDIQINQSKSTKIIGSGDHDDNDEELEKIDQANIDNPQFVGSYAKQIFAYIRATEDVNIPKLGMMIKTQIEITDKMRASLIDWLIEVHQKFKLFSETLYLTVNIVDRYLAHSIVSRQNLQLLGITALLIACKYEEITPPDFKDFQYIVDESYTKEEILEMEGKILVALNINLSITSPLKFLERYGRIASLDEKGFLLAKYLLEASLIEYKMLKYLPSQKTCSVIYIVNKYLKKEPWPETLAKSCQYNEIQLKNCVKDLIDIIQSINLKGSHLQAVKKKYSHVKYGEVAKISLDHN